MLNKFILDNTEYTFAVSVKRRSVVVSSDNSGMLMDGTYYNDVIGTYLEYDVSFAIPEGQQDAYVAFYEAITSPVAYHDFVLPYNNQSVVVRGRIQNISDTYMQKNSQGKVTWRNISFTIIESVSHKMASGSYTPVVPPTAYITAENVDEHLVFTIVDFDEVVDIDAYDEHLYITLS